MEQLRKNIEELSAFQELLAAEPGSVTITGVAGSLLACIAAGLRDHLERQILIVASDEGSAERLKDDLAVLLGGEAVHLFAGTGARAAGAGKNVLGMRALRSLKNSPSSVLVTTPRGLATRLPAPSQFDARSIELVTGGKTDLAALTVALRDCGFLQKDFVEVHGDFAVRGGILDVYTFAGENPLRAEFAGDEIESIREFDPLSQRSIRGLQCASILPDLLAVETKTGTGQRNASLLDYADDRAIVVIEEPELIDAAVRERPAAGMDEMLPAERVNEILSLFPCITLRTIAAQTQAIDFGSRPQPSFNGSIAALRRDLAQLQDGAYSVTLACDSDSERARLRELLGSIHEHDEPRDDEAAEVDVAKLTFSLDALHEGFLIPDARLALYTEHQVFGRLKRRGVRRQPKFKGFTERELQRLVRGDYVVHKDYGIGKFDGLKRIRVGGAEQEVVKILYDANDVLYVNLNYVNKLQKYSSKEGHIPSLTRLGSSEWEKLKLRAKKRVKDIARDLITLYARRKRAEGFPFSQDTPWQQELEASFIYEDTRDQAKATIEVKRDMETPHPMDRLICGDVGFGKTEVAVRASFKAVLDGKQVAVLVPTTILATQHFGTFQDRLARYGVRLDVMSRFRSKQEQSLIVGKIREGLIDVIIGTHRLLSKDVTFKNLGLLIIDEEHRFGVAAKEKLRRLKNDVDTLSLTATPIPRTLHFSLMGARDLSIIATPPRNRLPIITEIMQWNDDVIRDAAARELQRGGQLYFVHDRVQTMDDVAGRLQKLLPDVRIRTAHGQMTSHALENVMMAFLQKECDVLVATKIIESGLDIPNVNTIFINRADRFGMAELYQLRGRVGRANAQAYAYLLTPPIASIPRSTLQRLQAVEEFTELGSGFNLAMRDLEIRGAGNLLGAEQSGFIENMGFEAYTRILEEAVQELKQEEFKELFSEAQLKRKTEREAAVEADLDAFIPESYVRGDADRLALYRRLYSLTTEEQLREVRDEMTDRFGKFPMEIENLFGMVRLRLVAAGIGFVKVTISEERLEAEFPLETDVAFYESETFQRIMNSISRYKRQGMGLLQSGKTVRLKAHFDPFSSPGERLLKAVELLQDLIATQEALPRQTSG
jgi:transcription-repair coupling factor (superfamily II helicase)